MEELFERVNQNADRVLIQKERKEQQEIQRNIKKTDSVILLSILAVLFVIVYILDSHIAACLG